MNRHFARLILFLIFVGVAFCAQAENNCRSNALNQRLKDLRKRLYEFSKQTQKNRVAPRETVELKMEKICTALEARKDVEVMVLFKDPVYGRKAVQVAKNEINKKIESKKNPRPLTIEELRKKYKMDTKTTLENANRIQNMVANLR